MHNNLGYGQHSLFFFFFFVIPFFGAAFRAASLLAQPKIVNRESFTEVRDLVSCLLIKSA